MRTGVRPCGGTKLMTTERISAALTFMNSAFALEPLDSVGPWSKSSIDSCALSSVIEPDKSAKRPKLIAKFCKVGPVRHRPIRVGAE